MMKRIGIVFFAIILATFSTAGFTETEKDETVYFMLNEQGAIKQVIVVNAITSDKQVFVDYGEYEQIQNLTSNLPPSVDGDKITFNALTENARFFYRGTLKQAVNPWLINITYKIDGVPVAVKDISAKKGKLQIDISVAPNPKDSQQLAKSFALQMNTELIGGASNIEVEGGTVVAVGSSLNVGAIFIPESSKVLTIRCDADEFEMSAITFTGIRAEIEDIEIDVDTIEQSVYGIHDGAHSVLVGMKQTHEGLQGLSASVGRLVGPTATLTNQSIPIIEGAKGLQQGLTALQDNQSLMLEGVVELAQGLQSVGSQRESLQAVAEQLLNSSDSNTVQAGKILLGQIQWIEQSSMALTQLQQGHMQLQEGLGRMQGAGQQLAEGIQSYTDGVKQLSYGIGAMNNKLQALPSSFGELVQGQEQVVDGISQAKEQLNVALDLLKDSANRPITSFVSEKNTSVSSVQFVMRTPEIRKPKIIRPEVEPVKRAGFWQRLINLFK